MKPEKLFVIREDDLGRQTFVNINERGILNFVTLPINATPMEPIQAYLVVQSIKLPHGAGSVYSEPCKKFTEARYPK